MDAMTAVTSSAHPVVLYDGECGFCSRAVLFVVERDPAARFRFAPVQSPLGQRALRAAGVPGRDPGTILLVEEGRVYFRSTAALRIGARLRRPWPLLRILLLIPRPLRDAAYDLVARHRHRLGGGERCVMPAELAGRTAEDAGADR